MKANKALIMVDLQNDFCAGGSLEVPGGEKVIPIANQLQEYFDIVIATQDWHPEDHMSFASNQEGKNVGDVVTINEMEQILWPDHCVQRSKGAELHPDLKTKKIKHVFHKGVEQKIDSYSAFFDNAHQRATGLGDYLKGKAVTDVFILGLATDYCVKYSALDAVHLGFNVFVIEDACKGVELQPGDSARALDEMRAAGVKIIHSSTIIDSKRAYKNNL